MTTSTTKENEMAKQKRLKVDATKVCAHCGRPIETCTVGGLHGMVRERAAKAVAQLLASGEYTV